MHNTSVNLQSAWAGFIYSLLSVCLLSVTTYAEVPEQFQFRAGLCNSKSHPLTGKQMQILLDGLRLKTGWTQLHLDENGYLVISDRWNFSGGSATARALIVAAVDGMHCFRMENQDYSIEVAFAQIRSAEIYVDADDIRHDVFQVEFDFKDFFELRGSSEVITAFDPAILLLHELCHGVLGLRDSLNAKDLLGECESHVNQIRRELRLPERKYYEARNSLAIMPGDTFRSLKSELIFVQLESDGKKHQESSLVFKTEKVSLAARQTKGNCAGLISARR
jgi:hypothetical protein